MPTRRTPKQLRQPLLRDAEVVDLRTVVAHQQPARQPRADQMEAQAGGRHCQLHHADGHVALHEVPQRVAARELVDEGGGPDAPGRAGALHHGTQRRQRHPNAKWAPSMPSRPTMPSSSPGWWSRRVTRATTPSIGKHTWCTGLPGWHSTSADASVDGSQRSSRCLRSAVGSNSMRWFSTRTKGQSGWCCLPGRPGRCKPPKIGSRRAAQPSVGAAAVQGGVPTHIAAGWAARAPCNQAASGRIPS